jgi:ribokinase
MRDKQGLGDSSPPKILYDIIGLGALNWDVILKVERALEGSEMEVFPLCESPGGSAANTLAGLAALGVRTAFLGAVGDDTEGERILEGFQGIGVDVRGIRVKGGQRTGKALCVASKGGDRTIYLLPGANDSLEMTDLDLSSLDRTTHVLFSSFVGRAQWELQKTLIDRVPENTRFHFSPGSLFASKGNEELRPALERTDVLFLNRDEFADITGFEDLERGSGVLLAQGPERVAVTLGGDPDHAAYIADKETRMFIKREPTLEEPVLDSTGAGDAFAAGYLFGVIERLAPRTCGVLGYLMSIRCIACAGPRAGLPDRPTLESLLEAYGSTCEA